MLPLLAAGACGAKLRAVARPAASFVADGGRPQPLTPLLPVYILLASIEEDEDWRHERLLLREVIPGV